MRFEIACWGFVITGPLAGIIMSGFWAAILRRDAICFEILPA